MQKKIRNQGLRRLAYFVTSHGYGHASRSCSVMQSVLEKNPQIQFEVFSDVPKWFFTDSLNTDVGYHKINTDIGMIQTSPFQGDLLATLEQLRQRLPFDPMLISNVTNAIRQLKCGLIICDISPLGISAADKSGIPSVLIENFTWDWIYSNYQHELKEFKPYVEYLRELYNCVTYHIKTEPLCQTGYSDLTVPPISRKPKTKTEVIRTKLGLANTDKIIIVTMGGIRDRKDYSSSLERSRNMHFIVPGASDKLNRIGNVTLLPHRSVFFHPDLINAADVVIGKAGYSTIAEVYHSGNPFGYVGRPNFPETAFLVNYIKEHMNGLPISTEEMSSHTWLNKIPQLISIPKDDQIKKNGADEIADFILDLLL